MAGNAIDELVSTLYEMVQDAGGIPLMSDRCVIEREKALDILDEIRANIPSDLKMAREIVEKRNEFITAGKREAEAIRKQAEELARQKQEAAQAAYDKNMGYLNEAYANRNNLLQQNYNDALAQLQASYDSGARGVNQNADSAQQQAYINYMMSKRDLPQALAAQGLTGGMSESALAGMYNSYGNNRNTIDRGRNESLAALLDTLNSNRSSALQSYNSQLSAAEQQKMAYQMQLEQALANGSAEILQNKYDTLQNLDNAYAQQILALQQAAAQAAQKRW